MKASQLRRPAGVGTYRLMLQAPNPAPRSTSGKNFFMMLETVSSTSVGAGSLASRSAYIPLNIGTTKISMAMRISTTITPTTMG